MTESPFFPFFFQGQLDRELTFLYHNVETFLLFVGHPRSGHSLVAAILDSHSEIIVSDEFNLLYEFNSFLMDPSQTDDERKLRIFFELHARSHRQARSGNRSPNCSSSYCYNIDGSWQGNSRWFFYIFLFIQGLLISFCEYVLAQSRIGATGVAVSVWDIEKTWPLFKLSLKGKHCTTPNLRE